MKEIERRIEILERKVDEIEKKIEALISMIADEDYWESEDELN